MAEYRMSMPGAHAHRQAIAFQAIAFAVASADRDALVQARQDHPARECLVPAVTRVPQRLQRARELHSVARVRVFRRLPGSRLLNCRMLRWLSWARHDALETASSPVEAAADVCVRPSLRRQKAQSTRRRRGDGPSWSDGAPNQGAPPRVAQRAQECVDDRVPRAAR